MRDYLALEKRALKKLRRSRNRSMKLLNNARGPRWFAHAWTSRTGIILLLLYITHSIVFTFGLDSGTRLEGQGPALLYYLFLLIVLRLTLSFKHTSQRYLTYKLGDLEDRVYNKKYNIKEVEALLIDTQVEQELKQGYELAS